VLNGAMDLVSWTLIAVTVSVGTFAIVVLIAMIPGARLRAEVARRFPGRDVVAAQLVERTSGRTGTLVAMVSGGSQVEVWARRGDLEQLMTVDASMIAVHTITRGLLPRHAVLTSALEPARQFVLRSRASGGLLLADRTETYAYAAAVQAAA